MTRGNILAGTAATLALVVAGCNSDTFGREWEPFRIKVMVEVETPEGVRSGASVTEVTCSAAGRALGTQGGSICRARGEAIAVDLPRGDTLFILVNQPDGQPWEPEKSIVLPGDPWSSSGDRIDQMGLYVAMIRDAEGAFPIDPAKGLPWFVRFKDIKDPRTVEAVDPTNLSKSFGAGYAIKSMTVRITEEQVTVGISDRLGWLKSLPYALSGESIKGGGDTLAHNLLKSDFKTGFDK